MSSPSRVWFITGTSSGLGYSLVKAVLEGNERVIATLRKPELLADLQSANPDNLIVLPLDVSEPSQISSAFAEGLKKFGRIDVVVNNAGYGILCEIESTPDDIARQNFEVQFWGPLNIMKEAIRVFRDVNPKGAGGRVINVSSIGGYSANAALSIYNASKFALEGLTEAFTKEMPHEWNIKGIIIEPGGFESEWVKGSMLTLPQHPVYTTPTFPSSIMRQICSPSKSPTDPGALGDPNKMAQAIIKIAGVPNPPVRLQLGSEALALAKYIAEKTVKDGETWAEVSHGTDRDGMDGIAYANMIVEHMKRMA